MTMFLLVENEKGIKDIEMIDNERDKKLEVKNSRTVSLFM